MALSGESCNMENEMADKTLGPLGLRLRKKLEHAFNPQFLSIDDLSYQHKGHIGARPEGESHFHIRISAKIFTGKSRLERHRLVNTVLAQELTDSIHAMSLEFMEDN